MESLRRADGAGIVTRMARTAVLKAARSGDAANRKMAPTGEASDESVSQSGEIE